MSLVYLNWSQSMFDYGQAETAFMLLPAPGQPVAPGVVDSVVLNTITTDTGLFSQSVDNKTLTANVPGTYLVSATLTFDPTNPLQLEQWLEYNSDTVNPLFLSGQVYDAASTFRSTQLSGALRMNVGDTLRWNVRQFSAVPLNLFGVDQVVPFTGAETKMKLTRIGR